MSFAKHFASCVAVLFFSSPAFAAYIVVPTDVSAFDRGSGSANGTGVGGLLQLTTLELGLTKPDANDPATWTTTRNWNNDFQGQDVGSLTSLPWIIFDFDSSLSNWDSMYIWNVSEATGATRGIKTLNLYYSNNPTVGIPVSAASNNLSDGAANVKNYDFTSGGWTKLNLSALSLDIGAEQEGGPNINPYDGLFDISGIPSARYIGIEALTSYAETTGNPFGTATGNNRRVGLNRAAFTAVPEPGSLVLLAFGMISLWLFRRKMA